MRSKPTPKPQAPLLTLAEVAAIAGVSLRTARAWVSSGRLRVLRLSPRTLRISQDALDDLLRNARDGGVR
jgi:excisionase family DNA binding protein